MTTSELKPPPVDSSAPVLHRPAIEMLMRLGGGKLVRDVIDVFAASAPRLISAARAGAESGDTDAVSRALHSLKSSAGQLGAIRMQQACEEGELLAIGGAGASLPALILRLEAAYADAWIQIDRVRRDGLEGIGRP